MAADIQTIRTQARRHVRLTCFILLALIALSWTVMRQYDIWQYYDGVRISALFCFVSAWAYSSVWTKVKAGRASGITKFYLVSSGVRLLAAAAVMLVYCLVVRDRESIIGFSITFLAFYFIMLIFDSIYYARIEKGTKQNTKK